MGFFAFKKVYIFLTGIEVKDKEIGYFADFFQPALWSLASEKRDSIFQVHT